jgi:hypothetical protein
MARKSDPLPDSFGTDDSEGWLGSIVAEEDDLDRHAMWRLGLWGCTAVGALTLGILSSQLSLDALRIKPAANDLASRTRQVEATAHENQLEARRLAAAVETLNSDRDRLFSRLSSLEQGVDVITGSIRTAEDKPATPWPDAVIAPIVGSAPGSLALLPFALVPAPPAAAASPTEPGHAPAVAALSEPPPGEVVSSPSSAIQAAPIPDAQPAAGVPDTKPAEESAVAPAEFGVDLGGASSINGLRALWRGLVKSHQAQLDGLRPLLAVQERRSGLGLQLRLIAGPIRDAAAAARICAAFGDAKRDCKTTAFDGQRLSVTTEAEEKAAPPRPKKERKSTNVQPAPAAAATPEPSGIASMFGFR